ncbi:hypothetical protein GDO81_011804 [Engystomops pustulosus]|uniref:Uncharacterized protein n=1 Tax=Engystomops pustulosus TaxID=76066 RepID=A0AAV7BH80_ENGPU|nr:hypothetical protein GDO81_011804 [Engystomops pustulosus]
MRQTAAISQSIECNTNLTSTSLLIQKPYLRIQRFPLPMGDAVGGEFIQKLRKYWTSATTGGRTASECSFTKIATGKTFASTLLDVHHSPGLRGARGYWQ